MTGTGVASPDGKGTGAVPPRRLFIEAARPIGKEVGNIVYPHQWRPRRRGRGLLRLMAGALLLDYDAVEGTGAV